MNVVRRVVDIRQGKTYDIENGIDLSENSKGYNAESSDRIYSFRDRMGVTHTLPTNPSSIEQQNLSCPLDIGGLFVLRDVSGDYVVGAAFDVGRSQVIRVDNRGQNTVTHEVVINVVADPDFSVDPLTRARNNFVAPEKKPARRAPKGSKS